MSHWSHYYCQAMWTVDTFYQLENTVQQLKNQTGFKFIWSVSVGLKILIISGCIAVYVGYISYGSQSTYE